MMLGDLDKLPLYLYGLRFQSSYCISFLIGECPFCLDTEVWTSYPKFDHLTYAGNSYFLRSKIVNRDEIEHRDSQNGGTSPT